MIAYTTITDYIHAPSGIEVAVYVAGLIAVVGLPALFFNLLDSKDTKKESTTAKKPGPNP